MMSSDQPLCADKSLRALTPTACVRPYRTAMSPVIFLRPFITHSEVVLRSARGG
jgi:hypothetical protein